MPKLGVNIDHIATLREARGGEKPDPVSAVPICEQAGCDSIVAHLREDRRHINDRDIALLNKNIKTMFNLEMSINPEIVMAAKRIKPQQATFVPEQRQELTTEGGLSIIRNKKKVAGAVNELRKRGIEVSIFIDPDEKEIACVKSVGANIIEIHTGQYSLASTKKAADREFNRIKNAVEYGLSLGLIVNVGHGLDYNNTKKIARIKGINELNIGHSIIARAVFTGLYKAVRDMKDLIK